MLCHNQAEYDLASRIAPDAERIWPRTPQEYFDLSTRAKAGLCNRMHASVVLAALGVPSIAVGTDTRLLMAQALGLRCFYVKDATVERLKTSINDLISDRFREKERLTELQRETWDRYVELVRGAL
jgi:hypothetical protein